MLCGGGWNNEKVKTMMTTMTMIHAEPKSRVDLNFAFLPVPGARFARGERFAASLLLL